MIKGGVWLKKSFGILMSLVLLLGIILVQLPQTAAAASYQKVVVRGSLAPLDWGTDNNPLTLQQDGTWKSNPIPLTGGNKLEFKYVRDDQWMDGKEPGIRTAPNRKICVCLSSG